MTLNATSLAAGIVAMLAIAGCAGSASTTGTLDRAGDRQFGNILIIGIAANYDGRAMFEREVASRLRAEGPGARASYAVLGGDSPITQESVEQAIQDGGFDAVLVTRLKDQSLDAKVKTGKAGAKATTKGGGIANLFRYDYEELDEPPTIEFKSTVVLTSDLYSATSGDPVWSIETTSRNKASIDELVDSTADAIVARLRRDRLIRH